MKTEYKVHGQIPQRKEYVDGITAFVEERKKACAKQREMRVLSEDSESLRQAYIQTLGYPLNEYASMAEGTPSCTSETVFEGKEIKIYRLQLEVYQGLKLYGMLFVPEKVLEKNALMLALHGAKGSPECIGAVEEESTNYNSFVRRLLKNGAVVFAPQTLIWNEAHEGDCYDRVSLDLTLKQCGGSIVSLELFCLKRALDYFCAQSWIDETRVGVAGMSYGGMYTLALSAIDTRIKATLCCGYFNDRTQIRFSDWAHFDQASICLDAEQAMLILPRDLYIEVGKKDTTFPVESALQEIEKLKKYAKQKGVDGHLTVRVHEGGHEVDKDNDGCFFMHEILKV